MTKKNPLWKKGRGKLGVLTPLIGEWKAEADTPIGKVRCTRTFTPILGNNYVQLIARWQFAKGIYEEVALYGVDDGKVSFWSFTSDGKKSRGTITDGSDVHPQAIAFEARMPAGLARMIYWPHETEASRGRLKQKQKMGGNGLPSITILRSNKGTELTGCLSGV